MLKTIMVIIQNKLEPAKEKRNGEKKNTNQCMHACDSKRRFIWKI
jgi:hypothetical protein